MTWTCTKCNGKNQNSSTKCRINKCHEPKPQNIIDLQKSIREIRDYCPICKTHQDFKRIKGKQYACQKCHRRFKFKGKPVPEKINNNESSETL